MSSRALLFVLFCFMQYTFLFYNSILGLVTKVLCYFCIHWGKRNLVTLLARTSTSVHILDLMFFYSTCSCQRRSGIFDCGTPWRSFHCLLDFCGQLFIMPSNEVLNPGMVLKRLFMYEISFNHKTTKRPITTWMTYLQLFLLTGLLMSPWHTNGPVNDKTNKTTCAPSEDSDQPGHLLSLIRVFAVRTMEPWVISHP